MKRKEELTANIIELISKIENVGRLEYICEFIRLLQETWPTR